MTVFCRGAIPTCVMPGLDPGISCTVVSMSGAWVYIVTNRRDGTLYVGVTSNIARRAWEHREGLVEGFTRRYHLKRLVHVEPFDDIRDAIQREKALKHWARGWKVELIEAENPDWNNLYDTLV